MSTVNDKTIDCPASAWTERARNAAQKLLSFDLAGRSLRSARTEVQPTNWDSRSERWGRLMVAAQHGDGRAYDRLLREIDLWLRRYYARRLPYPASDDARQDTLLAIHAKRNTYAPSRAFGAWVTAIARYKGIDRIRDASRFAALPLDEDISTEDHERAAVSAAAMDNLLGRLKPAQATVIRLVKLNGLSIARASGVTGQSAPLVKINIHRGLKRLAALVSSDVVATTTPERSPKRSDARTAKGN